MRDPGNEVALGPALPSESNIIQNIIQKFPIGSLSGGESQRNLSEFSGRKKETRGADM